MAVQMASSEQTTNTNTKFTDDQSLKLAVAISLLRSKLLRSQQPPSEVESNALRWKRKAKERKQELIRLREDLREAEDASHFDLVPQGATCKCFFYDNLGKISSDVSDQRFSDVLRRRFLRQVRIKEHRRTDRSNRLLRFSDLNWEDEAEQLKASIDFLVKLCDSASPMQEANFANWSHQAVDFILASSRNLLSAGKNMDFMEGIVSSLNMRLIRRICFSSEAAGLRVDTDDQFYIQHLIRKLGSEAYIGQRALLSVSERISVLAENLLVMDPFDDAFPHIHRIQLMEFLVSDYLVIWSKDEGFDNELFEEWLISLLHARKAFELLESRNGLYALYMDRVLGQLTKQVCQVPSFQKLNRDILNNLLS